MATSSTLKWVLLGEDKTGKAFKSAASGLDVLSEKSKDIGKGLSTYVTAPLAAAGAAAVLSASNQQQAFGALDSVFKGNADAMKAWSAQQAALGLSATEAANSATYMGSMLKNAGLDVQAAAGQSQELVTLGADLAATFGGPTSDAVAALGAALRGEMDPIERYGVSVKQADINARLAALGQDKLTGEARKQAEMAARLALITEQTADAQGQAAREADTFAGTTGRLKATLANTAAVAGTAMLPAITDMVDKVGQAVTAFSGWFTTLSGGTQRTVIGFAAAAAAVGPLLWGFGKAIELGKGVVSGFQAVHRVWQVGHAIARVYTLSLVEQGKAMLINIGHGIRSAATWVAQTAALVAHKAVSVAVSAATKAMAAAQWLLNVALNANPIGLVVLALAALGAGLVLAWKKSETFRNVVKGTFEAIAKGVLTLGEFWLRGMKMMVDSFLGFVGVVIDGAAKAFGWVPGIGDKLKGAAAAFGTFRSNVSGQFDKAITKVGEWKSSLDAVDGKTATAKVDVDPSGAKEGAAKAQGYINGIDGRTVPINLRFSKTGEPYIRQPGTNRIIPLATGGIVTGPTIALVGEAGPEAVIPLDRAGAMGGVTVNIYGGLDSSEAIARRVQSALLDLKRRQGVTLGLA